jgi:hypothetical protein
MSTIICYRKPKIKCWIASLLIIFLCVISCNTLGISLAAKQKYPFTLLTNDYGILNDHDLSFYLSYLHPAPFPPKKEATGCIYWQCFPRENISITLEDYGYFENDFRKGKDTLGNIEISAMVKPGVFHNYLIERAWPVNEVHKGFNNWRKLMKGEKYVCLAGGFVSHSQPVENGIKRNIFSWSFERLKTKKGCVAYFDNNCD